MSREKLAVSHNQGIYCYISITATTIPLYLRIYRTHLGSFLKVIIREKCHRPEIKKKIFDPFFTTKRGHGGSGLGLHFVYNLVSQKLQGTIECKTQMGIGTKFIIRFSAQIGYQD